MSEFLAFCCFFLVFCNTLLTLLLQEFHHQHSFAVPEKVAINFVTGRRLFKLFRLVWWMCASTASTALWFQHLLMKPGFITCYSCGVIEKFIAMFVVSLYRSESRSQPLRFCAHPWAFSEPILLKTCDSLACDILVQTIHDISGKSQESSEIANIFWSTHWTRPSLTTEGLSASLFVVDICFSAHLWKFNTTVLPFLHSLHFGHKPRIIHNGFPQHSRF
jgi:hypothetical protein